MTGNISGISSYQQNSQAWTDYAKSKTENAVSQEQSAVKSSSDVKVSQWKPIANTSVLVPTQKDGYGTVVGNVELSDKAKKYYETLKSKYHGMDFILVSKDLKSQVEANASSYGSSLKPVVLIDDEKIERMANDENYRKKFEGIIAMSQAKLLEAKNSLVSSGANVKTFGMTVSEDGKASFFATVEKANAIQREQIAKKQAEKKLQKAKEQKKAEKEAQAERIENRRKANKAETDDVEFRSDSLEDLIKAVSDYAYANSAQNVVTEQENLIGQMIDFKG